MYYEFRNEVATIEVDCLEWFSLAKLASDIDLPLLEDYTYEGTIKNENEKPMQVYPIQKVSREDAASIGEVLQVLWRRFSEMEVKQALTFENKYRRIEFDQDGVQMIMCFALGIHEKTLCGINQLYTEAYFQAGHIEVIQNLIEFFAAGECELNWTILMDDDDLID